MKWFDGEVFFEYKDEKFYGKATFEIAVDNEDILCSERVNKVIKIREVQILKDCSMAEAELIEGKFMDKYNLNPDIIRPQDVVNISYICDKFSVRDKKFDFHFTHNECAEKKHKICPIRRKYFRIKNEERTSRADLGYCPYLKKLWFDEKTKENSIMIPNISYDRHTKKCAIGDGRHRLCIMKNYYKQFKKELSLKVQISIDTPTKKVF